MREIKYLLLLLLIMSAVSCNSTKSSCTENNSNLIEIKGIIQKQGITIYQYGTHTVSEYALRSSTILLDEYVHENVIITGYKIDGYPIEGGPEYIDVVRIKLFVRN